MIQNRREQQANRKAKRNIGKLWPLYSQLAEELHSKLGGDNGHPVVLGCSAASKGSGASTVAVNLAASFAMGFCQKALLINATENDPRMGGVLGPTPNEGLEQLLHSNLDDFDHVIRSTKIENVDYLGNGLRAREQFSPHIVAQFSGILDYFREKYSTIVVDLPSQDQPSGSSPLASKVDGLVLVVQPGKVKPEAARRIRDQLGRTGANLVGAVMNRCDK